MPLYPADPANEEEEAIKKLYARCLGSAVNPVLREGNSDRRAPQAVKEAARRNPHSMGAWSNESRTHVATMSGGDFFSNEQSVTCPAADTVRIEHVGASGEAKVLKEVNVLEGEVCYLLVVIAAVVGVGVFFFFSFFFFFFVIGWCVHASSGGTR